MPGRGLIRLYFPVMPEVSLEDRLKQVGQVIADRQAKAGLTHRVRVIAVTKTFGPATVRAAQAAGLLDVGENRVQEAIAKQDATDGIPVAWHLIGGLQSNKVRLAMGRFALIHSLDRINLAEELHRRLLPGGVQEVLVQVNCSDEAQKGGVMPDELPQLLDQLQALSTVRVRGLMTMAALTADEAAQRRTFAKLRQLRDRAESAGHRLPELSMGMSNDFGAAVTEGATMLRLGSVLFGARDGAQLMTDGR